MLCTTIFMHAVRGTANTAPMGPSSNAHTTRQMITTIYPQFPRQSLPDEDGGSRPAPSAPRCPAAPDSSATVEARRRAYRRECDRDDDAHEIAARVEEDEWDRDTDGNDRSLGVMESTDGDNVRNEVEREEDQREDHCHRNVQNGSEHDVDG